MKYILFTSELTSGVEGHAPNIDEMPAANQGLYGPVTVCRMKAQPISSLASSVEK